MKIKILLYLFILFFVSCSTMKERQRIVSTTQKMTLNDSLVMEMHAIFTLDQGIRDTAVWDSKSKVVQSIDSVCFVRTIDFIKKYGWPTHELKGKYADYEPVSVAFVPVMLHHPNRMIEPEIHELLVKQVRDGKLKAETVILFFDKYWVFCKGKSLYNTGFKVLTRAKGVLKRDKELSDSLMREIGLDVLPDSVFVE